MPIVNFHLLAGQTTPEQDERLLVEASRLYSELLAAPIERVRTFITAHAPGQFAVGGEPCSRFNFGHARQRACKPCPLEQVLRRLGMAVRLSERALAARTTAAGLRCRAS